MDPIATAIAVVVVATILGSIAVVKRLDRRGRRWGDVARSRLVMGVPWGTLVVIALVCCVYLFVQDGIGDFADPVVIPFRAWSYFYPLGMLTAGLSHAGPNHLTGNLIGTLVVAPIAEFAWGHYPAERDSESVGSWRTEPWVRALVVFPLAAIGVALLTSFFALGPVIGFSGVVFAFAGFAIVHYPIATILAVIGVRSVLGTVYRALQSPIYVYTAEAQPPAPPSWATIAIQGHALGFFVGLVLGVLVLQQRNRRPDALRTWLAILLYGFSSSLWAIYWFGESNTYVLFRGPGVVIVSILALVVTVAIVGPETPLVPPRLARRLPVVGTRRTGALDRALELGSAADHEGEDGARTSDRFDRIRAIGAGARTNESRLSNATYRGSAFLAVLVVFAIVAGIAIPVNLLLLDGTTAPSASEASVEVEDYTVMYAEDVENELVSAIAVGGFDDELAIESSGVIVVSEERNLWLEAVSAQQLAFDGEETIYVGGPGWREAVHVERTGWNPVGNETVYQVRIWADGADERVAYESNTSQADLRIADRNVTIASEDGEFQIEVESNGIVDAAAIPDENETVEAGGLTFEREGATLYASADGTEVAVAREETYR
ncbi:rhomboid family intramembrane serine protease [Halosolutus gelatinilyticus]|uniref:rhomboid family intramembrane serine protease n=1 Tax=Halosolutus gelatinilyticus TaxID=2931975 RepID=UPI001FF2B6D1|nr:rhomboid family intramembrane serine protease [Halosolutus gelatinilyticus]